ncbi:Carbohydrate esterase family 1 protein [Mycena indigotica]|uniref:feruloyl esterase n=1 Tax=Mycena indigotica TaxID=2126181 RepID=A0A8H6T6D3_9AGAR|nr:Carbohydrate esterase family 1 protein [Mycena indigotica]KAF7310255.1 Carbohydrate esterase family 1 protein [Mycena indigotica]
MLPLAPLLSLLCASVAVGASAVARGSPAGTAGCGTTHFFNGLTQYHSLTSNGTTRHYSIHLPSSYDKNKPYPLVLGFHGSSGIGLFFELDTRLSSSDYTPDKIMLYPDGLGGAWAGANYSVATVPQDLLFVSDLLDEVRAGWCIDNSRIYATGISAGGGFVNTIACSPVGANFAAFALGSGSLYTDATGPFPPSASCVPARSPLPVLEIHGGADPDVHYAGGPGEGGIEPAIPDWLGWWAQRNGCATPDVGKTVEDLFNGTVHHWSWTCGGVPGVVQHWKVDDMKHCWASTTLDLTEIAAGQGTTPIDASTIVIQFFDQFTKP